MACIFRSYNTLKICNLIISTRSITTVCRVTGNCRSFGQKSRNGFVEKVVREKFYSLLSTNKPCKLLTSLNLKHYSQQSIQCWKCGSEVDEKTIVFCGKCKVVQRPKSDANYFQLLGQKQSFDLNTQELTKKFRILQMQLHPDRFTQKQEEEQNVSAEYSSLLNRAYRTLLSPIERGLYLLELEGLPLLEGEIDLGQEFYFDIMELNEELAEAEDAEQIERIERNNQLKVDTLLRDLSVAFEQQDLVTARLILAQLKYFVNIQEKIKQIYQERGIMKD